MTLRTHRLRIAARVLHRARLWAKTGDPWMADRWDDYDEDPPDDVCLHCHGDGMDPDCDYLLPCPDCGGYQ